MNQIIKEKIYRNLNESAFIRSVFILKLSELERQIAMNLILISYCEIQDSKNKNYNHWLTELKAHLSNIQEMKLKLKNSYEKRKKYIEYEMIESYELNTDRMINLYINELNKKENINIDIAKIRERYLFRLTEAINIMSTPI